MTVLSLRDLSFSYGGRPLIEHAEFQLTAGERVALVGRNGTGKSTLLKLIARELKPDHGAVEVPPTVRIATQTQEVPADLDGTIFEEVAAGLGTAGPSVAAAYRLHHEHGLSPDEHALLEARAATLDHEHAWQWEHDVLHTLGRMQLDPARRCSELSSGMKRRVLLARALVTSPEVLLLDEPTNHLDIEAIQWLEDFLSRYEGTLVFITHDRVFLQKVARRIVEIDRARLFDWTCDYATFLERKEAALAAEEQQQDLFDKKLAVEEAWIRQGVKARRVRNEGRVRALMEMRKERAARRAKVGVASAELHQAERSGQLVLQTKDLSYEIGGRTIVSGLTTTILRGDKVGLIGPNGSGKTTLLKLLLGQLVPTSGTVRHGTRLEIAYFDQLRTQLDGEKSVIDNVSPGEDQLLINGRKRHIISYLEDYLFTPERSRTLVRYLSGGERNRLMLARLLAKPSNLLVLDEPTNDLDAETLELLESVLVEYGGTILLVSHDRAFLNHVATQTLAFEGDAVVREYTGGYDDYVRQRAVLQSASARPRDVATSAASDGGSREPARAPTSATTGPRPKPLSFKEERERAELPAKIESWETTQAQLEAEMASPSFYQQGKDQIAAATQRLEKIHADLAKAYERWDELEARAQAASDAR